jgi:hypothetical protein
MLSLAILIDDNKNTFGKKISSYILSFVNNAYAYQPLIFMTANIMHPGVTP